MSRFHLASTKPFIGFLARNWLLVLGVAVLAVPTFFVVANEIWSTEEGAHGPIVLASVCWLVARQWPDLSRAAKPPPLGRAVGWMGIALLVYLFGRLVGILGVEVFGLVTVLIALFFAFGGVQGLRALWFPILYLGFLVPLPDTVVDLVTQPMKLGISSGATAFLRLLGYPIANTGVTIQVGPYQLLVATACSGLNSIISLSAIGLFYVYLMHRSSWRYALVLLAFVLPCALLANFARVVLLVLLTYHAGDATAQGFLHEVAGTFTFVVALLGIFAIDRLLAPLRRRLSSSS